jgi:hypothetical protein
MQEEEEITRKMNVGRQNESVPEENVTQKMSYLRQGELSQETDVLQKEFIQKHRIRKEVSIHNNDKDIKFKIRNTVR